MSKMKIAIVGGTFDGDEGKASGLINKIGEYTKELVKDVRIMNGGNIKDLINEYERGTIIADADVIFWFCNVPNEFAKYRELKAKYPRKMLVTSKRNFGEYSFSYLVNHALTLKSNLVLEFSKGDNRFNGRILDPLGVVWHDYDSDFRAIVKTLVERLEVLRDITRQGTIRVEEKVEFQMDKDYLEVVKRTSDTFHELIKPVDGVTRFLGNSSFRCQHGFPSTRTDGGILVTRRNIDKRDIGKEGFVPVKRGSEGEILYFSEHKPSVDTPIQLSLYEYYKDVNYMLHSHVYIEDALFTFEAVPCGGLEEVDEILKLHPSKATTNVAVNLIGHGSLIMAETVDDLKALSRRYYARPMPEIMNQ